jgi:hypothetical protein
MARVPANQPISPINLLINPPINPLPIVSRTQPAPANPAINRRIGRRINPHHRPPIVPNLLAPKTIVRSPPVLKRIGHNQPTSPLRRQEMTARLQRNPIDHSRMPLNPIVPNPRAQRPLVPKRIGHDQRTSPPGRREVIARQQRNPTVLSQTVLNPTRPRAQSRLVPNSRVRKRTDPPSRQPGTSTFPRRRNRLSQTAGKPISLNYNGHRQIGRLNRNVLNRNGHRQIAH